MQTELVASEIRCEISRANRSGDLASALDRAAEILTRPECQADELEVLSDRLAAVLQRVPPFTSEELASEPLELYRDSLHRLQAAIPLAQQRLMRRRGELQIEREELVRLKAWNAGAH